MDALKRALAESGPDAQANARRWVVLGMLSERAGFRAYNGALVAPAGGFSVPSSPTASSPPLRQGEAAPAQDVRPPTRTSVKKVIPPSSDQSLNDSGGQFSSLMANIRSL